MISEKEEALESLVHAVENEYHRVCRSIFGTSNIQLDDLFFYCRIHNKPLTMFLADIDGLVRTSNTKRLSKALERILSDIRVQQDELYRQNMKTVLEIILLAEQMDSEIDLQEIFERKLFRSDLPKGHRDRINAQTAEIFLECVEQVNRDLFEELPNWIEAIAKSESLSPTARLHKLNAAMNCLKGA